MGEPLGMAEQQGVFTTRSHKKGRLLALVISALLVVIVALTVGAIATGRLYVGVKDQSQKIIVQTAVCSIDPLLTIINGSFQSGTYRNDTKSIVDAIQARSNYKEDPTCAQALFSLYIEAYDIANAEASFQLLQSLANRGLYPSNGLTVLSSIDADKAALAMIKG